MDPDIKLCSLLCDLSFENAIDDTVINAFGSIGLNLVDAKFTTDRGSVSFSYDDAGRLFIAWRGTKTFLNFVEDADILKKNLVINGKNYGRVHGGMADYYDAIKEDVTSQIDAHLNSGKEIKSSACLRRSDYRKWHWNP